MGTDEVTTRGGEGHSTVPAQALIRVLYAAASACTPAILIS